MARDPAPRRLPADSCFSVMPHYTGAGTPFSTARREGPPGPARAFSAEKAAFSLDAPSERRDNVALQAAAEKKPARAARIPGPGEGIWPGACAGAAAPRMGKPWPAAILAFCRAAGGFAFGGAGGAMSAAWPPFPGGAPEAGAPGAAD